MDRKFLDDDDDDEKPKSISEVPKLKFYADGLFQLPGNW
jgi:hypothetical protein